MPCASLAHRYPRDKCKLDEDPQRPADPVRVALVRLDGLNGGCNGVDHVLDQHALGVWQGDLSGSLPRSPCRSRLRLGLGLALCLGLGSSVRLGAMMFLAGEVCDLLASSKAFVAWIGAMRFFSRCESLRSRNAHGTSSVVGTT
eukprot:14503662-Alexandrium_andersonii.AAC.1